MLGFQTDKYESYVDALPKISNYGLLIINANTKGKGFITKLEKLFQIGVNNSCL